VKNSELQISSSHSFLNIRKISITIKGANLRVGTSVKSFETEAFEYHILYVDILAPPVLKYSHRYASAENVLQYNKCRR
jgi:hypothetical protein